MNTNIPVKIMRVEDWKSVATAVQKKQNFELPFTHVLIDLISRYEKETSQILERKHFVCEVEKPNADDFHYAFAMMKYTAHQSQLVFEGFEKINKDYFEGNHLGIYFSGQVSITIFKEAGTAGLLLDKNATIYDFIYYISKYNETATQKINLKFTETFIKRIVG